MHGSMHVSRTFSSEKEGGLDFDRGHRFLGGGAEPVCSSNLGKKQPQCQQVRRARVIPMEAIRDDTVTSIEPHCFDSAEHFLEAACAQASRLRLDRTEGRKSRLAVFCEATGLVPQLARVAEPYGIRVVASGGFDSLTFKHGFAVEVSESDRPFEVLHIGDHDPSGGHMFVTLSEDITAFVRELRGKVVFTRVAVTPAQVAQYDLPTAPQKPTDKRAFHGSTCQAEALAPDAMNRILQRAIEQRTDRRALCQTVMAPIGSGAFLLLQKEGCSHV